MSSFLENFKKNSFYILKYIQIFEKIKKTRLLYL